MYSLTAFPFTSELTYDEQGWPVLDRAVGAETLRKCLANYFTNGVFLTADANCFKVSAPTDGSQTVLVAPGVGLINGATGYTAEVASLSLPAADGSLPRVDSVVLRLNDNTDFRNIYIDIITGTPASSPVAPALTQTDSIWELGLANLYRAPNSSVVTNANITDTRADSSRCGQVTAIIEFDTSVMMQQLNAFYDEFVDQCDEDYRVSREAYLQQCDAILTAVQSFETATEADVLEWFDHIKGQIDADAAVHLQNEIDQITEKQFLDLYGLCTKVTRITKNPDGSTASILEDDQDGMVDALTTFEEGLAGKTITTVVTPANGNFKYVKTAVFEELDDYGSKRITESYSKIAK